VYGALAADALGPLFKYYDEWPMAAGLLKSGVQHETSVAHRLINEMHAIGVKPHFQDELSTHPWNMTDDAARKWVEDLRNVGCSKNPSIVAVAKHAHIYILPSYVAPFPSQSLSSLGCPPFHSHDYIIISSKTKLIFVYFSTPNRVSGFKVTSST
jgi:hypothetical protein